MRLVLMCSYFLQKSYRYRYAGEEHIKEAMKLHPSGNVLIAVFHEYAIGAVMGAKDCPYTILVSESQDGSLINAVIESLGLKTLRGSSSRGGVKAFLSLYKLLKKSHQYVAITVDGPRGPRHEPKAGLIELALRTGIPIIPIVPYTASAYLFKKSWDQTQLPYPFSKILFYFGKPLLWNQQSNHDENFITHQQQILREEMLKTTNEAKEVFNHWSLCGKKHIRLPQ